MINFASIIGLNMSYLNNVDNSSRNALEHNTIINVFLLRKIFLMEQYLLLS
jgi:hypothetical protein